MREAHVEKNRRVSLAFIVFLSLLKWRDLLFARLHRCFGGDEGLSKIEATSQTRSKKVRYPFSTGLDKGKERVKPGYLKIICCGCCKIRKFQESSAPP